VLTNWSLTRVASSADVLVEPLNDIVGGAVDARGKFVDSDVRERRAEPAAVSGRHANDAH
jgi:hypothetical protein